MTCPLAFFLLLIAALLACFLMRRSCGCRAGARSAPQSVTKSASSVTHEGASLKADVLVLENCDVEGFIRYLEDHCEDEPALNRLLDMYRVKRAFPDMSHFRLGPNMFEKIPLNWIVFVEAGPSEGAGHLIGHGVTTGIHWDEKQETLPDGWQGAVRAAYQDVQVDKKQPNTHVGLFICIEERSRQHGWAGNIIKEMKGVAMRRNIASLIIPLRPPTRYQKEYAGMPMGEFAALKREDGLPMDHWVRLHVRLGARAIGVSNTSHQHAFSLKDFYGQVPCPKFTQSGYGLVQQKDGAWYNAYVDLEREFVLINQGCVWVQHPLSPGPSA